MGADVKYVEKLAVVFLVFFFLFVQITAESANEFKSVDVKQFSLNHGLSQSTVNAIVQDDLGYYWVGTGGGLNRYNAHEFKHFYNQPGEPNSLPGNYIGSLYFDSENRLWVGTYGNGLSYYTNESNSFVAIGKGDKSAERAHEIYEIIEDEDGYIWASTNLGFLIVHFMESRTVVEVLNYTESKITSLRQYSDSSIIFGTESGKVGVISNKIEENLAITFLPIETHSEIVDIFSFGDRWFFATKDNGISQLIGGESLLPSLSTDAIENDRIVGVKVVDEQHVLVYTDSAEVLEFVLVENTFVLDEIYSSEKFATSNIITSYVDNSENIWLGTVANGLYSINTDGAPIRNINGSEQSSVRLSDSVIWAVTEYDEQFWVGTNSAIDIVNLETEEVESLVVLGQGDNLVAVEDATAFLRIENELWIGTWSQGLIRYNPEENRVLGHWKKGVKEEPFILHDDRVRVLHYEKELNRLWVGHHNGLDVIDRATGEVTYFSANQNIARLPHNRIRSIYQDLNSVIWVGTSDGVVVFDENKKDFSTPPLPSDWLQVLNKRDIRSIYLDTNYALFATGSGLIKGNRNTGDVKLLTTEDGLSNNVLYSLIKDKQDRFWITTNYGLSIYNPSKDTFENYYSTDGLQSNEFNFGAFHKTDNERFFLGGVNGLSIIDGEKLEIDYKDIPLVIDSIKTFDTEQRQTFLSQVIGSLGKRSSIELKSTDSRLSINFSAIDINYNERISYRYKLSPQDKAFSYVDFKKRQADYTNLKPGEYEFEVALVQRSGQVTGTKLNIPIVVEAAFWQTNIFKFALFLVTVFLFMFFAKLRIRAVELKNSLLNEMVAERTSELNDSVNDHLRDLEMIIHDLKNPIFVINHLVKKISDNFYRRGSAKTEFTREFEMLDCEIKQVFRRAEALSKLAKLQCWSLSEKELVKVKPIFTARLEAMNQQSRRLIYNEVPNCIVFAATEAPALILENIISNALKYSPEEQKVTVKFDYVKDKLWIDCRDLGVGIHDNHVDKVFDLHYRIEEDNEQIQGQGIGLAVVKKMVNAVNGEIEILANHPVGTKVRVAIPCVSESG